jgi:hypothetical protein
MPRIGTREQGAVNSPEVAMQQFAEWLESLGLSRYAKRFAENDIDFTILGDLTDQDLEKIGIVSLGHRRNGKLLRNAGVMNLFDKSVMLQGE